MRTFFVGRHQKTWSSWCHAWVHQLLKDPEAKPQQQQHCDLKAERQRWYTFLAVDLTSETGFILKSSSTGVSAPRKRIHTVYMHRCWLKVETWWHGWKQLPLSPVSIELVMQLQSKWLTCLPRNHVPGCQKCQQGCGSSAKSRFNIVQLWFKQDLRPIAKPKLLMVHDDSIPQSGVPRTPKSLYNIFYVADISDYKWNHADGVGLNQAANQDTTGGSVPTRHLHHPQEQTKCHTRLKIEHEKAAFTLQCVKIRSGYPTVVFTLPGGPPVEYIKSSKISDGYGEGAKVPGPAASK